MLKILGEISHRLATRHSIECLARQLDISSQEVQQKFDRHRPQVATQAAIFEMLTNWLNRQNSRKEAYLVLSKALTDPNVDLSQIAKKTLDYFPVHQNDKIHLKRKSKNRKLSRKTIDDDILDKISVYMSDNDIKRLAPKLKISPIEMYDSYTKHDTDPAAIQGAVYDILKTWSNKQNSCKEARNILGEALIHSNVGLNLIAREVLNYPPAKEGEDEPTFRPKRRKASVETLGKLKCKLKFLPEFCTSLKYFSCRFHECIFIYN